MPGHLMGYLSFWTYFTTGIVDLSHYLTEHGAKINLLCKK